MSSPQEALWQKQMAMAQQGDKKAYELLLVSIIPALKSYVGRRLRNPVSTEDIVQEILISIHRSMHTYNSEQAFAPWLFSIARYRLVDDLRRSGRRNAREILHGEWNFQADLHATIPDESSDGEWSENFGKALKEIPERQRRAVLLLKQDDLSVKEAAQQMGVSESALKVLAHRGYNALRALLTKGS